MESNFKKIYQLLTIIMIIQSLQFIQYNYVYISVFRNVIYYKFKGVSDNYSQISAIMNTAFSNLKCVFNYSYSMYETAGSNILRKFDKIYFTS